jgi:hypothetical protein
VTRASAESDDLVPRSLIAAARKGEVADRSKGGKNRDGNGGELHGGLRVVGKVYRDTMVCKSSFSIGLELEILSERDFDSSFDSKEIHHKFSKPPRESSYSAVARTTRQCAFQL